MHLSEDGYMAVIAILFDYGPANPFFNSIIPYLTNVTNSEVEIETPDLARLMKDAMADGYYFLQGSLSSPPCTQGISWAIARRVVKAAPEQIDAFAEILQNNVRYMRPRGPYCLCNH